MDAKNQKVFTPTFISEVLGPPIRKGTSEGFARIHTDSRNLAPDDLFLPLKGEKFDGETFIPQALVAGVNAIISTTEIKEGNPSLWNWVVEDTLLAYRKLGAAWLKKINPKVFALGGSVGKTTTKDLLTLLLGPHTHSTQGSQNGFVGIPMTLLGLREDHTNLVLEVGIDEPGAMAQHCSLFTPHLATLTKICEEHMETMKSLEKVIKEEMILLNEAHKKGALVFINGEDPHMVSHAEGLKGALVVGGKGEPVKIHQRELHYKGESYPFVLEGKTLAQNQALAMAMALEAGCTPKDIKKRLLNFKPPQGRMNLHEQSGVLILADYYNALPEAMGLALEILAEKSASRSGQRWLCLGDMLELGEQEQSIHESLAAPIHEHQFEHVLLLGPRMNHLHQKLPRSQHFQNHEELAQSLKPKTGDTVLIKGSRGMRMEKIFEALHKEL